MTVRISDKLSAQVTDNIMVVYRKFIEDAEKEKPDVGDRLYEIMYGPHLPAMNSLPTTFFRRLDRIDISCAGDRQLNTSFKLSDVKLAAYTHPSGEYIVCTQGDRVGINRTSVTEDIVDAILSWRQRIDELYTARDGAIKAVRSVFKKYASLPPAIKTFPPLVDLLPPEIRRKIEVPQHRLSSVEMEINPDLKRLARDIAIHKILNR
jgi:hypothetical protein